MAVIDLLKKASVEQFVEAGTDKPTKTKRKHVPDPAWSNMCIWLPKTIIANLKAEAEARSKKNFRPTNMSAYMREIIEAENARIEKAKRKSDQAQ